MSQETEQKLQTDVAVLKRDINQFGVLFNKLDVTIEKIGDVSNNISRLLAVHEERLDTLNQIDKELEEKMERHREVVDQNIKELHARITKDHRDVCSAIDRVEKNIKAHIDKEHIKQQKDFDEIENRLMMLEKWKWMWVGGAVAVGWLLSYVDVTSIFQ